MTAGGVIVLQARLGSRRLPGKVLMPIAGRTLLSHCVMRLRASGVGELVVATTTERIDDAIAAAAAREGVRVVRGAADDVLGRFAQVVDELEPAFVVRATADNPAVDIDGPRRVIEAIQRSGADHIVEAGLPYGAAVEAIRPAAIRRAARTATRPDDREHVTPFIRRETTLFRSLSPSAPSRVRRPDLRVTVDTLDDAAYMAEVLGAVGAAARPVPLEAIIHAADRLSSAKAEHYDPSFAADRLEGSAKAEHYGPSFAADRLEGSAKAEHYGPSFVVPDFSRAART